MSRSRVYLNVVLSSLLLIVGVRPSLVIAATTPSVAQWTAIITLALGSGNGQVSYENPGGGGSMRGPQALGVAPDGVIYVLDSVNRRVHVITGGQVQSTLTVPTALYPRDILATTNYLYILDDNNRILELTNKGLLIREVALPPGLTTNQVYRLYNASLDGRADRVRVWAANYREFDLDQLPSSVDLEVGVNEKDFHLSGITAPNGQRWMGQAGDMTASSLTTKDSRVTAEITANGIFGTARLIGFDQASQPYMQVEDLYDDHDTLGVELTVRRYGAAGQLTGVARLPGETLTIPSTRYVEVMADGTLYVMLPTKQGTSLYHVTLGQSYTSVANRLMDLRPAPADASNAPDLAPSPLTRREARDRGYAMSSTIWTWHYPRYDYLLNCNRPANMVKPAQLQGQLDGSIIHGIPYTWGGFDSLWTHSDAQPWTSWDSALAWTPAYCGKTSYYGPLVGNATNAAGWINGSVGLDCSGFVAAASGKYQSGDGQPKPGTGPGVPGFPGLPDADVSYDWKGSAVGDNVAASVWRAQPMNFFVGTTVGHTFFYQYGAPDATSIITLESTIDGPVQGAKPWSRTWSEARGYQYHRSWWPRNYNNNGGDGPREPRTAAGFWSASYAMRGQSVWYRFDVTSARYVTLNGISGGDPDLYVYSGDPWTYPSELTLVGSSKSTGGNEYVWVPGPGTYYARVYVYSIYTDGTPVYFTINW